VSCTRFWRVHQPMTQRHLSRRSFLETTIALAGVSPAAIVWSSMRTDQNARPLVAYVGTFSAPLRDTLPTQVDLPPGNGRGIHRFRVNRETGAWAAAGVHEMGTSPSCLAVNVTGPRLYSANETDQAGEGKEKEGTVS